MATTVAELVAKLTMNSEEFKRGVDDAGRAGDKLTTGFKGIGVGAAAIGAAVAAAGVAIAAFARQSLTAFEALADTTRDLAFVSGATAKEVSGLIDVLDDYGIEAGTVQRAMVFLSRAVQEGNPALERLGVTIRSTSGHLKTAHDLFYEVVEALKNTRNETERNAIAQEIFSRGWTSMVPIIQQGSAALKEAAAASKLTMSEDDLKRAMQYKLAVAELTDQFERFKMTIGRGIVAPITVVVKWISDLGDRANKLFEPADLGDPAERARRWGEAFGPKVGAGMPSGAFSSDVGAWRFGAAGADVTRARPIEGPTKGELEASKKLSEAEAKRIEYLAGIEIKAMENLEKERAEFLKWDTDLVKEGIQEKADALKKEQEGQVALAQSEIDLSEQTQAAINEVLAEKVREREEIRKTGLDAYLKQVEIETQVNKEAWDAVNELAKRQAAETEAETAKVKAQFDTFFQSIGHAFTTSFDGVIQGTQSVSDAFRRMGQSILLTISDTIINQGLKQLQESLWTVLSPYIQQGLGGLLSSAFGSGASFDTAAWATSSGAASSSFVGFAEGGIVTRPTMAMVGEGGQSEAIVPLSRAGEFGFGGGGFTQNIIVNTGVPETVRREINAMRPQLQKDAVDAMLEARNRGGIVAKAFGSRNR